MSGGPLEGIIVVALEQAVAAPFCTARLADAGARIIKIERQEGDFARHYDDVAHGESAYFVWLNRGKESIILDIKDQADAKLLSAMIARADVLIQNLAPGALARAGFSAEDLRRRHPRLITCDISGYGEEGPFAEMKAYDFLIQSETGLASITGSPAEPARVGVSVADICCGMNAHAAVLQALYERERTGQGKSVAISMFDGLADWMTVPLLHFDYAGKAPTRQGLHHATIAPYGAYKAGDGGQVVFAVQSDREWRWLCKDVLKDEALAADPLLETNSLRCANRARMDKAINAALAGMDTAELIERLRAARIAFGAVNTVEQLSKHPQLRRIETPTPTGPVRLPAPPARWANETFTSRACPALDEHGAALRAEFAGAKS